VSIVCRRWLDDNSLRNIQFPLFVQDSVRVVEPGAPATVNHKDLILPQFPPPLPFGAVE
jgi:hypothetical protein